MSLINVLDLSLSFLGKELFHGVGFQVEPGDRVGLVGPNGSGKTSLMRLLIGDILPNGGDIMTAKGTRIGYLPQDIYEVATGTLLQSVLDAIPNRVRLRNELQAIEQSPEKDLSEENQVKTAAQLAQIHQELNDLDREFPVHSAEKILVGLGFKPDDFPKPVTSLSGGWKMRAALGSILYQTPDLLLLDEPTNHLDLPSVRWLEEYLQSYKGALILICHDRDFLNRQIKRVLSFEPEGLKTFNGNYDGYMKGRDEERKTLEAKARNQEQKIKEAKRFIERFRAKASKARQAQSKIKLASKIELINTHQKQKTVHFSFPEVTRSGREVISLRGVSKGFGNKNLYRDLDLSVFRGERVAIIGPNGSGKTTLLRMVAGEIDPDQGDIVLGHGVTMSYYAQHLSEMLNAKKSIIEEVYQAVPHETISFVRGICGAFLFSGEDVDKSIGILSGGERARVSLAKILVKPGNLLVMDEPTNHLDLISSEILIDALHEFEGTLFFVSHNQSFVNRLATKIWDIKEEGIHEYPGTLYEYYRHLSMTETDSSRQNQRDLKDQEIRADETPPEKAQSRKIKRKEKAERRRQVSATLEPIREKLKDLEARIDGMENRKAEMEKLLADPDFFKDKGKSVPLLNEYNDVRGKLEELLTRWEYQQEALESTKKELGIQ